MSTPRNFKRIVLWTAIVPVTALLGGCLPLFKTPQDVYAAEERHPIAVDADTASISVPVEKVPGLTAQSERDVRGFMAIYKARGHGPVSVARPVGGENEKNARHVQEDILRVAAQVGVDPVDLAPQTYKPSSGADAPVLVSFTRFVASVQPCGDWSKNYGSSLRNTETPNFGCATQNTLAAAIDDPHDLVAPRGMGAADAERRTVVFDKYRKGETTITDRKDTEKSDVASTGAQ